MSSNEIGFLPAVGVICSSFGDALLGFGGLADSALKIVPKVIGATGGAVASVAIRVHQASESVFVQEAATYACFAGATFYGVDLIQKGRKSIDWSGTVNQGSIVGRYGQFNNREAGKKLLSGVILLAAGIFGTVAHLSAGESAEEAVPSGVPSAQSPPA